MRGIKNVGTILIKKYKAGLNMHFAYAFFHALRPNEPLDKKFGEKWLGTPLNLKRTEKSS